MYQRELHNFDTLLSWFCAHSIGKPSLVHVAENGRIEILDIAAMLAGFVQSRLQRFTPGWKKLAESAVTNKVQIDVGLRLLFMEYEADRLPDSSATSLGFKEPVSIIHQAGQIVGLLERAFQSPFQPSLACVVR